MEITMRRLALLLLPFTAAALGPATATAQQDQIESARRAGPASVSNDATIMNWNLEVIHEGTNGWTCLPDRPDTEGDDPWCVNEPWLGFLKAYVGQTEPSYDALGIAYMLMGDSPVSNSDPYATGPTTEEDWVTGVKGHLMLLLPDPALLEGITTDHRNGGPWVMWAGTPYVHLMIPVESRW